MRRFTEQAGPAIVVRGELPFTVLTRLSLITLYLYYDEAQDEAMVKVARAIRDDGLTPSPEFNAIFGEGFALRDTLAMLLDLNEPRLETWHGFISYLEEQDAVWWRQVAEASIYNVLDFSGHPKPRAEDVDNPDAWVHYHAEAVAQPNRGASAKAIARLLADPGGALKANVLAVLHNTYPYIDRVGIPPIQLPTVPRAPNRTDDHFVYITGYAIPPSEAGRLRSLDSLIFLATPRFGAGLEISYFPGCAVISFDPGSQTLLPENDHLEAAASAFDALSNIQRLRILAALAKRVEMYGLQIAEELDIPQATVSNHLAVLQAAGLIGRRPTGRRVYYGISPRGVEQVDRFLDTIAAGSGWRRSAAPPVELTSNASKH